MRAVAATVLLLSYHSLEPAWSAERWRALFIGGEYERAAHEGRASKSDDGLAFAARAVLARAMTIPLGDSEKMTLVRRAERDARAALKINPSHVEASLQLSIALGQRAKLEGVWSPKAWDLALGARRHIEKALALAPSDPWANALLGAWQMTVSHHAGPLLAKALFDTSWAEGVERFREALSADPRNILLHVYFAEALALEGQRGDTKLARLSLLAALSMEAKSSLERTAQAQAALHLTKLGAASS